MINPMQHFTTKRAELTHGKPVRLEIDATFEHSDSYSYTFRLANGTTFTLPREQRLNDLIMWHGEVIGGGDESASTRRLVETIERIELIDYNVIERGDPRDKAAELLIHYAQEAERHADQVTQIHQLLKEYGVDGARGEIVPILRDILDLTKRKDTST